MELLLSTQEAPGKRGKASVVLGFLSSYEGMGLARVECRSGCTCAPSLVDGLWSERTSLMQLHSFKVRRWRWAGRRRCGGPCRRAWPAAHGAALRFCH